MTDRLLYEFGDSPCCMKVRMALSAKSLPWTGVFIESWKFDHFQPDYLAMNPDGTVPTLVDGGRVVTQSNVIIEYIDDEYPQPPLRPDDAYKASIMRKWMFIEQDQMFKHIVTLSFNLMMKLRVQGFGLEQLREWSLRHPDQGKAQDYLRRLTAPPNAEKANQARHELRTLNQLLEHDLGLFDGPWVCGNQLTLAEIALGGIFDRLVYLEEEDCFRDLPRVDAWFNTLCETDIYRRGEHRFSARMWGPKKPVETYRDEVR